MARDQIEVMSALGFERFALAGHDRGARVGHRLALDHPDRVSRIALLDIVPTLDFYPSPSGGIGRRFWRAGRSIAATYLPEEAPAATEAELRRFLAD